MDTYEAEGFFPEREVLRARRRRLEAAAPAPVNISEGRKRRTELWVLWVAVFVPTFVNTMVFGWNGHMTPRSITVLVYILAAVLAASGACVAVGLWRNLRRPRG